MDGPEPTGSGQMYRNALGAKVLGVAVNAACQRLPAVRTGAVRVKPIVEDAMPVALDERFAAGGAGGDAAFPIVHIAEVDVLESVGQGDVAGLLQDGRRGPVDVVQFVGRMKRGEKNFPVLLRVTGRQHPHAENAGPHQNQRLAARPLAQPGQRLPEVGLALLLGSGRETSKGNWV